MPVDAPGAPQVRPSRRTTRAASAALVLATALLLVATLLAGAPGHATTTDDPDATTGDDAHPAELQPAPEDGQEEFGEPADEDTERVARLLRLVLGGIVAVVVLLLVIVLPLKLRRRGADRS